MRRVRPQVVALFVAPEAGAASRCPPVAPESNRRAPERHWRPPVPGDGSAALASGASAAGRTGASSGAAVLGRGTDALALAAALAGELRVRDRARAALLLVWNPPCTPPAPLPAWPGARDLAAALADGHPVAPRGRLVSLQLPPDPATAAAAATALAGRAGVPTVLVLSGPRSSDFDDLLASRDLLVVVEPAGSASALGSLAAAELRRLNRRVLVASPLAGRGRRLLASAGLGRARHLAARRGEGWA